MNNIANFIVNFKRGFDKKEIENIFMNGNCYHFATILNEMFVGCLIYDMINCHFMFMSFEDSSYSVYDITGGTSDYNENATYPWLELQRTEPDMAKIIEDNCINLINK